MCLRGEISFSKVDEVAASLELSWFTFDQIGYIADNPFKFCAHMLTVPKLFREHRKHDLCEDG